VFWGFKLNILPISSTDDGNCPKKAMKNQQRPIKTGLVTKKPGKFSKKHAVEIFFFAV